MTFHGTFDHWSALISRACASAWAFSAAALLIILWLAFGPAFGWSDAYNLYINTVTTIVTFLLAFIILNSNARSEAALQLKLDELIRVTDARNDLIAAEQRPLDEIEIEAARLRAAGAGAGPAPTLPPPLAAAAPPSPTPGGSAARARGPGGRG